jgi:hypothetical protein
MHFQLAGMILRGSLNPMDEVLGRSKAKCAEAGRLVMTGRISGQIVGYSEVMAQVLINAVTAQGTSGNWTGTDHLS